MCVVSLVVGATGVPGLLDLLLTQKRDLLRALRDWPPTRPDLAP